MTFKRGTVVLINIPQGAYDKAKLNGRIGRYVKRGKKWGKLSTCYVEVDGKDYFILKECICFASKLQKVLE